MAYIRLTEKDSQVYVFMSIEHGCLTCLNCLLMPDVEADEFLAELTADMIAHLEAHKKAGHRVPEVAFDRLRRDAEENDQIMRANS